MPRTPDDLALTWRRYDWRESLFAPGLVVLQALTATGKTASGAGWTRDDAFARCVGETAEHIALEAADTPFAPDHDGIAAHPIAAVAQLTAMHEAIERDVISQWWLGQLAAQPISTAWLAAEGLTGAVQTVRKGAAQQRKTQWWQVMSTPGPCVIICRGASRSGQDPIFGYGCDTNARQAAAKALREMLLMELNLMEVLAARSGATDVMPLFAEQRIVAFAQHGASILPGDWPIVPHDAHDAPCHGFSCHDITPPDSPLWVWRCCPDHVVPASAAPFGAPFF